MDISQIIQSIGGLPWWAILVLLTLFSVAFVVILGAALWNGFNLKIIKFDGLKKISKSVNDGKKEQETFRNEFPQTMDFKRNADDIDRETKGDIIDSLYSLTSDITDGSGRCSFIGDSVRNELRILMKNYINKNHVIIKCYPENMPNEKKKLLTKIKEKYKIVLLKMGAVKCEGAEPLPDWKTAKGIVNQFLNDFFDIIKKELINGCERKIRYYQMEKSNFTDPWIRSEFLDKAIKKNEEYIRRLKER